MRHPISIVIPSLCVLALATPAAAFAEGSGTCADLAGGWSGTCRDEQGQTKPGDFVIVQNRCSDLYLNNVRLTVPSTYSHPSATRTASGSSEWLNGSVLQLVDTVLERDAQGATVQQTTIATSFAHQGSELTVIVHTVKSKGDSGNAAIESEVQCVATAVPSH